MLEFTSLPRSAEHGALTASRDPASDTVPPSCSGEELGKVPTYHLHPPSGSDVLGGHKPGPPLPPHAHSGLACSLGDGQHRQGCKTQLGTDAVPAWSVFCPHLPLSLSSRSGGGRCGNTLCRLSWVKTRESQPVFLFSFFSSSPACPARHGQPTHWAS